MDKTGCGKAEYKIEINSMNKYSYDRLIELLDATEARCKSLEIPGPFFKLSNPGKASDDGEFYSDIVLSFNNQSQSYEFVAASLANLVSILARNCSELEGNLGVNLPGRFCSKMKPCP